MNHWLEAGESTDFLLYKNKSQSVLYKRLIFAFLKDVPWPNGKSTGLGSSPRFGSANGERHLISFISVS